MATKEQALKYAQANPDDPLSKEILRRFGVDATDTKQNGVAQALGGVITGVGKGAASTIVSVPANIARATGAITEARIGTEPAEAMGQLSSVTTRLIEKARELPDSDERKTQLLKIVNQNLETIQMLSKGRKEAEDILGTFERIQESVQPKTTAEKVGFGIEKTAELLIPGAGGAKALASTKVGRALSQADDLNLAGKALRSGIKGVGEGVEFAAKTAAQSSAQPDAEETLRNTTGALILGAVMTPIFDVVGAGLKGVAKTVTQKVPERIVNPIFKASEADFRQYFSATAKGQYNPTLAREAIEKGIVGSPEQMAVYSFKKLADLEDKVQAAVKFGGIKPIKLENKTGITGVLKMIADKTKGSFFSERQKTANSLIKELKNIKGDVPPDIVLRVRRFIDGMRNSRSFLSNPALSVEQESMKGATDYLRKKLKDAGLGKLMDDERIFIESLDAIVKYATANDRKAVIGLVDLIAGGGGWVSGGPLGGFSAAVAIRLAKDPKVSTRVAQWLTKLGDGLSQIESRGLVRRGVLATEAEMLNR